MTNLEIKTQIDSINDTIKMLVSPNTFTLNNTIISLLGEVKDLQAQCSHNFVDGYCEFCYKEDK